MLVVVAALVGCSAEPAPQPVVTGGAPGDAGGAPGGSSPAVLEDDAYPVINTFLLALEAEDVDGLVPLVTEPSLVDAEVAAYGGLRVDYFSVVVNFDGAGSPTPDEGQFRARVGDPGRLITLRWRMVWTDGQWRVVTPPDRLTPGRIG